jgi:acetyl esterase/lipase
VPDADLPDAVLRHAGYDDAVVDLHLPGGALPHGPVDDVLVLLHGGFWKAAYDRRHTREMARALAEEGWLVATPEYRRVGNGGGWPTTAEDVRLAVRRLPELLASLGVEASSPPVVAGHSAGGHLALWLASTGLPLRRVVGLAPVCDLARAARLDLGDGAVQAFLAGHDRDQADPMVLLSERPDAEVVLVHGVDDEDVPLSLSRSLVEAHPWVVLHEVPGDHFGPIRPGSAAWPTVVAALS